MNNFNLKILPLTNLEKSKVSQNSQHTLIKDLTEQEMLITGGSININGNNININNSRLIEAPFTFESR